MTRGMGADMYSYKHGAPTSSDIVRPGLLRHNHVCYWLMQNNLQVLVMWGTSKLVNTLQVCYTNNALLFIVVLEDIFANLFEPL